MKYILYLQAKGYASTIRANRHTYNIAPNFSHSINTIISEHMEIAYSCQSQHAEGNQVTNLTRSSSFSIPTHLRQQYSSYRVPSLNFNFLPGSIEEKIHSLLNVSVFSCTTPNSASHTNQTAMLPMTAFSSSHNQSSTNILTCSELTTSCGLMGKNVVYLHKLSSNRLNVIVQKVWLQVIHAQFKCS